MAPWIKKEINFFKKTHGNFDENIITVLASGELKDAIPDILMDKDEDGQIKRLLADYRKEQERHRELPRIIATLIGCEYDELVQRSETEKRRRLKCWSCFLAIISIIFVVMCMININHKNNTLCEQSQNLFPQSENEYEHCDREGAAKTALEALSSKNNSLIFQRQSGRY